MTTPIQVQEVESYETSGSALEKALFRSFMKNATWEMDHDTDEDNWSETEIEDPDTDETRDAVDGDKAMPITGDSDKVNIGDTFTDVPVYKGPGSKKGVTEEELIDFFASLTEEEIAELDEGILQRLGSNIKGGAKKGAQIGAGAGRPIGAVVGSVYGATAGAAAGAVAGAAKGAASEIAGAAKSASSAAVDAYRRKQRSNLRNKMRAERSLKEGQEDVRDVYRDETSQLLGDIRDLYDTIQFGNHDLYAARTVATRLRELRDYLLGAIPTETTETPSDNYPRTASESHKVVWNTSEDVRPLLEELEQGLREGKVILANGATVSVTEEDVAVIRNYFDNISESAATKLMNTMVSSVTDFNNILEYARLELQEVSKERAEKYLNRAVTDHGMANFAKRQTEHDRPDESAFWKRKEQNRKKGISRAIDVIDAKGEKK